jgi:hypothetical protein
MALLLGDKSAKEIRALTRDFPASNEKGMSRCRETRLGALMTNTSAGQFMHI